MGKETEINPFESPPLIENPFAESANDSPNESLSRTQRKTREIGELFLAWERLRIIYNIVLAVTTAPLAMLVLLRSNSTAVDAGELIIVCIAGFLGANFCFLLGHYLTSWLVMFGARGKPVTIVLFWCGVGISIPAVIAAILGI
jgi:hypothetical protein